MARIIAVTNQKGGVGKTTSVLNLGAGLRRRGRRVLFVDMDPQCNLSYCMGVDSSAHTVQEVLAEQITATQAIQSTPEGDLIAASANLGGLDATLRQTGKEFRLREVLSPLAAQYDFILIDSPPTLGILTVNILTAADGIIVPALADIFSLLGVGQLYATIEAVRAYCNPALRIYGILLTRHTDRFILSRELREMLSDTAAQLGTQVFSTTIREAVALREAQASRQSIFTYAPKSKQAADYEAFIEAFLRAVGT